VSPDDLAGYTDVLDRWFSAFNRHDVDALLEIADRNVEVVPLDLSESAPRGTTYHGREGLRTLLTAGFQRFPQLRIDHSPPQPNGSQVTVHLEFLLDDGVASPVVRTAGATYRIVAGRITRIRGFEEPVPLNGHRSSTRADALSRREREVLSMLAAGHTVAEIAKELVLSPFTIRTHVRNAKDKLQARTTAHAVAIALDEKVLDV
jgi:DNA-binding CsgD family transcriptional regulator/ketosteroid isomerase-like protein